MIALITGGSGCGKSTWAERWVKTLPAEKRVYLATMKVYDEESVRRVARHRAQRADHGFVTVECEKNIASVQLADDSIVLLEDVVNLVANEMFDGGDVRQIVPTLRALALHCRDMILVTNDVFSDGESYTESTQAYIRALADINRQLAEWADCVVEVIYSIPVVLKGALPCL